MNDGQLLLFFLTILTLGMFYMSLYIRNILLLMVAGTLLSLTGILLISALFPYYVLFAECILPGENIPSCTLLIGQIFYGGGVVLITIWQGNNIIKGKQNERNTTCG